jgi:hypothetical protein
MKTYDPVLTLKVSIGEKCIAFRDQPLIQPFFGPRAAFELVVARQPPPIASPEVTRTVSARTRGMRCTFPPYDCSASPTRTDVLRRLVRHDDRAGGGEQAADAVADRDPGAGDLGGGDAAHLAHALLERIHAVHAGMHVGETAAVGVERQFAAGGGVMLGDEGAGLAARHKAEIFEAVDRQTRAFPLPANRLYCRA